MTTVWPPALQFECDVRPMFDQDTSDNVVTVGRVTRPGRIVSVELIPNWTLAGANSNYRTLNLYKGATLIATLALTSGVDLTTDVAKAVAINTANAAVVVGDVLKWVTSATGTGAADAGGRVIVQMSAA